MADLIKKIYANNCGKNKLMNYSQFNKAIYEAIGRFKTLEEKRIMQLNKRETLIMNIGAEMNIADIFGGSYEKAVKNSVLLIDNYHGG